MGASSSATIQHLLVVFGGRVAFVALSFVGTSLVLRTLGKAEVGIYWMCLAAVKIVTGCLADSLDFAVLRSVPQNLTDNRAAAMDTLRSAFWLRIVTVASLLVLVTPFAPQLAEFLFKNSSYGYMLPLTAIAAIGEMLVRSAMGYFQAAQRFKQLVILDVLVQSLRFGAVIVLMTTGSLSAGTALCAYLIAPFIAFGVGLFLLPLELRIPQAPSRRELHEVYRYSRWMVLTMALAAVYERADVMLLGMLRGPGEVGIYAPAVMLATTPELIVSVVLTVMNPQVTQMYREGQFLKLVRQYLRYAVPIGLAAVAGALLLGGPVISMIFGAKYVPSIPLFKILVPGTIFFAVATPAFSSLLSLVAPQRVFLVTIAALALVSVGGFAVIPGFGATGTAVLLCCVRIAIGLLTILLGMQVLRRRPKVADPVPVPVLETLGEPGKAGL